MHISNHTLEESEPQHLKIVGPHWCYALTQALAPLVIGLCLMLAAPFIVPSGVLAALGVFAFGAVMAAGAWGYGVLVIRSTRFELSDQVLMVRSGIFTQSADAVRIVLVLDADVRATIWERLAGSGTVSLKLLDRHEHVCIPWVPHPSRLQQFILARAARFRAMGVQNQDSDCPHHN